MNYEEQIEQFINSHIESLLVLEVNSTLSPKVSGHITRTKEIQKRIQSHQPKDYRHLIEYLSSESRMFGWSYPEDTVEEKCEDSYQQFWGNMRGFISGMTGNERLFFFGYLDDYDKLSLKMKSTREEIKIKLFMK